MASPTGYTRTQIRLHWITVALVALQYILHDTISDAWDAQLDGATVEFHPLIAQHVLVGSVIAVLVIWRLSLRYSVGAPPPPEDEHPALKLVSHVTHWAFYALLILLPFSGGMAWLRGIEQAAQAHNVMKFALLALIALHVAAALMHHFVKKNGVLLRMRNPVD